MTTVLTTFAEASVIEAEVIAAVVRTKARVAAQSAAFCGDQSTNVWFPVAPGATQPAAPAPTTNASPAPPNSVALPPGFDPTDTCFIFQDLLPLSTAPVYAEELEPTIILEPYSEIVPLLGITVVGLSIHEYPYELTLPGESIAAVIRMIIDIPTYILGTDAGTFTTTGQAASLNRTFKVIGAAGTFTLTGAANGFLRDYVVAGAAGSYALAGQDSALVYQRNPFTADAGAFLLQGQDTEFFYGKTLSADAGSFALSGEAAGLSVPERVVAGEAGTFALNGQAAEVGVVDPYFAHVSLLLHMDGTDNSTTFTDSSSNNFTVTASGNAKISTAEFIFGNASGLFDGNGDYLDVAANADFNYGTADFTVEFWIRSTNAPTLFPFRRIIAHPASTNAANTFQIWHPSDTTSSAFIDAIELAAPNGTGVVASIKTAISDSLWHHVAFTRSSGSTRAFLDGVLKDTVSDTNNYSLGGSEGIRIGGRGDLTANAFFNGRLDEVRITKGIARYVADFPPPGRIFPDS